MTNEELVRQIQAGKDVDENMTTLYKQNMVLIRKIAQPYTASCEMDNLLQEAYFGLVKAVNSYDPEQEFLFMTYAEWKIRSQVQRYYTNFGRAKRIPDYMLTLMSKYQKFKKDYVANYSSKPSDIDFMEHLKIDIRQLRRLEKAYTNRIRRV